MTSDRPEPTLLIGQVARRTGVSTKTIRYYEDCGLIDPPDRTGSGYRSYRSTVLDQVRFIQGAKVLGLSLAEIRDALVAWRSGESACEVVRASIQRRLEELDHQIAELCAFRDQLRKHVAGLDPDGGSAAGGCRHVEAVLEGAWPLSVHTPEVPFGRREGKRSRRSGP